MKKPEIVGIRTLTSKILGQNIGQMKLMKLFRNPLKIKILGGLILFKKDLEKSKSKRENALAVLKLWEENLKQKNEVDETKVYLKKDNEIKIYD